LKRKKILLDKHVTHDIYFSSMFRTQQFNKRNLFILKTVQIQFIKNIKIEPLH